METEISNFSESLSLVLDEIDASIEQELQSAIWLEKYYKALYSEVFEKYYQELKSVIFEDNF